MECNTSSPNLPSTLPQLCSLNLNPTVPSPTNTNTNTASTMNTRSRNNRNKAASAMPEEEKTLSTTGEEDDESEENISIDDISLANHLLNLSTMGGNAFARPRSCSMSILETADGSGTHLDQYKPDAMPTSHTPNDGDRFGYNNDVSSSDRAALGQSQNTKYCRPVKLFMQGYNLLDIL